MDQPHDEARLGLVREILGIVLGLSPEVEERVMSIIRGSVDSADIRTPEMRQRIGPRAMKYLTNAIDLARTEGAETHGEETLDVDLTKQQRGDLEPGHKHRVKYSEPDMTEGFTFKDFLINESTAMVDTNDPEAIQKLRQKQRMSDRQVADKNIAQAQDEEKAARETATPSSGIAAQKAQLQRRVAQLDKKLATMRDKDQTMAGR